MKRQVESYVRRESETLKLHIVISGTFSVACLMIGTAVTKGYANSESDKTDDTSATNITDSFPGATSSESMSGEELSIRLSYALSLTFMVGILQVSQYVPVLNINVYGYSCNHATRI